MKIKLSQTKLRRKYNAVYRLRQKLPAINLAKRCKVIYSNDAALENIPEMKILTAEFGFTIQPELF